MTPGYLLVACGLPILVGGLIYLLFRSTELLMFRWVEALGLDEALHQSRAQVATLDIELSEFTLFCLPDGVWVFACTAFFARLWHDGPLWMRVFWIGLGPVLAIGGELGQIIGFVPGTFDLLDMLAYGLATVGALAIAHSWPRSQRT